MSRIGALNARYATSAALVRHGVELAVVGDPVGARLNATIKQLLFVTRDDGLEPWENVLGAAKALRWRLVTQPQPFDLNPALGEAVHNVKHELGRLRGAVGGSSERLLDELAEAVERITESDPVAGAVLLRSIKEVGSANCVVVAANGAAAVGLETWLGDENVAVRTAARLERETLIWDQAYAVGPPRFFRSSIVTAPTTRAVNFVFPAWYADRSIPRSVIAAYSEGAIKIQGRVFEEGDLSEPPTTALDVEDDLMPQPVWRGRTTPEREPTIEEVVAHRVLLSGNLAILLDDGDRIRSLEPSQPSGERVSYTDVSAVRPSTYLLLREGQTERRALYDAALKLMGPRGRDAEASQLRWKSLLEERLSRLGHRAVARQLQALGVQRLERVQAWTEPTLARPQNERDFELLIQWLGLQMCPTLEHATRLRRLRAQASADVRWQLEEAVAAADLSALERVGYLRLEPKASGFRGIIATRVLAISPDPEIVSRREARIPFKDRGAQWLE